MFAELFPYLPKLATRFIANSVAVIMKRRLSRTSIGGLPTLKLPMKLQKILRLCLGSCQETVSLHQQGSQFMTLQLLLILPLSFSGRLTTG